MAIVRHLDPIPNPSQTFRGSMTTIIEAAADQNIEAALLCRRDTKIHSELQRAGFSTQWPIVSEIVRLSSTVDQTFIAIVSDGKRHAAVGCGGRWVSERITIGEPRETREEAVTDLLRVIEVYRTRTDDLLSAIAKTHEANKLRDLTCAVLLALAAAVIYCGGSMSALVAPGIALILSGFLNFKEAARHGNFLEGFPRLSVGCGLIALYGISNMLVVYY